MWTAAAASVVISACGSPGMAATAAAVANSVSLSTLVWAPFGRVELGWSVYHPRIAAEIGTTCGATTTGFAAALATWQRRHGQSANGVFEPQTFAAMKALWQAARPFTRINGRTACPEPPPVARLEYARATEGYGGKVVTLRIGALKAYRAMVADARKSPGVAADTRSLKLFSGYRDPTADAERCARDGNCNGIVRATCSAHRTGLAIDLWVGQAPGYGPDSSADANRAAMVATPAYRWLIVHARRHGFVNYAFEPWHWEWIGEPVAVASATPVK